MSNNYFKCRGGSLSFAITWNPLKVDVLNPIETWDRGLCLKRRNLLRMCVLNPIETWDRGLFLKRIEVCIEAGWMFLCQIARLF